MNNLKILNIKAKKIGVLIIDARIATGKSKKECANAIGVSRGRFVDFERGVEAPSLPELEGLAYYLGVPVEHFWGQKTLTDTMGEKEKISRLRRLIHLRSRIVGVLLSKARTEAGLSKKELAEKVGVRPEQLISYENSTRPIPFPELEVLARELNREVDYFRDQDGIFGTWEKQQKIIKQFLELPQDLQEFVTKSQNRKNLEFARCLSNLSTESF